MIFIRFNNQLNYFFFLNLRKTPSTIFLFFFFVYEMILNAGFNIGTPCTLGRISILGDIGKIVIPSTLNFFGLVQRICINVCIPNDIITTRKHIGFVADNGTSIIAASPITDTNPNTIKFADDDYANKTTDYILYDELPIQE
ncbi:hypothetical protein H8356DRAFT_1434066 [Neocallimastix lanati (nom. inval.)]|nr:hypothetical protein H8356DRAFT_1434066 [Neocallimastix sp. JGI-2020a]